MNTWMRPDPTPLRHDFYQARFAHIGNIEVAIAAFRGEAAVTHQLIHVFPAMNDAILGLLESAKPDAIILDLRELKYSYGDEMAGTLGVPNYWFGGEFPVAVIVSELNRTGLTSLVRDEMFSDPAGWLTHSEGEAMALLKSKLRS